MRPRPMNRIACAVCRWRTIVFCALTVLLGPADPLSAGDEASKGGGDDRPVEQWDFRKDVQPFFKTYCTDCHNGLIEEAGLNLQQYGSLEEVQSDRKTWKRVLKMVESGAMPPDDHAERPTPREYRRTADWIEYALFHVDCEVVDNPGHVTIRRLNRAEYNNTIRDLVGVDFQPAKDFPSDDVGYGFDNIGEVLTLPPLLFEKYLKAAEKIAAEAIVTRDRTEPVVQRYSTGQLEHARGIRINQYGFYRLSSNGEVFIEHEFPATGDYVLSAEAAADQAGDEPAKMQFRLDGKAVKTFKIEGERKPKVYKTTLRIERGKHKFAAAFINDYYRPEAEDEGERDRNLGVRFLEIDGPDNAEPPPLPETHKRILFVTPNDDRSVRECAQKIVKRFAERAFRRPVNNAEVEKYVRLVELAKERGESFERGIQVAVTAILVSPDFLFRIERGSPVEGEDGLERLDDYAIASRLSYFLWSSMPDEKLFKLAEKGVLHKPEVLERQVRRMLASPKAQALVDNFFEQWLNLRLLEDFTPDPEQFPNFDEDLRQAMIQETKRLAEHIMREDRSILEFINGKYTFLNERLAKHYGIDGVQGEEFRKVSLEGTRRGGVLTQSSVLALTSNPTRTSPVKRGKWVLENILNTPPPDPPADVPALEEVAEANPNAPLREQLALHRKHPTCASCHRTMDPIGLAFENFDVLGRWRTKDATGNKIDASGELPGGVQFGGPGELVEILGKRREQFSRCLTEKLLTYALGRGLKYYDKCTIDRIVEELKKHDYRFSVLVTGIVQSDPFLMRRNNRQDAKKAKAAGAVSGSE